jgi:hypothetical protein
MAIVDTFRSRGLGDEVVVTLHRIGREIGEPGDFARRGVADGERTAVGILVEARFGAAPELAVFGDAGVVIGPAAGIGAGVEPGDHQLELAPRRARDAEVEPLLELALVVRGDCQRGARAVHGKDFDIAAVERAIDPDIAHSCTST